MTSCPVQETGFASGSIQMAQNPRKKTTQIKKKKLARNTPGTTRTTESTGKSAAASKLQKQHQSNHNAKIKQPLLGRSELKKIGGLLKTELERTVKNVKASGQPRLYYLSYLFRNRVRDRFWGRLGAVHEGGTSSRNSVYCDARVGSYAYDNISNGGLEDNNDSTESYDYTRFPVEIGPDAVRFQLWKLTDARFREAAEQYYSRKSRELHFEQFNPGLSSNRNMPAQKSFQYKEFPELDRDYWQYIVRKAGRYIKRHRDIKNSWFEFAGTRRQNIFVNSHGSEVLTQLGIYELRGHLWTLTPQGEGIAQEINLVEGNLNDLPDEKEFINIIKHNLGSLRAKARAQRINSYSGPVLLAPSASGVFFHEVIGHRLEGSRLLSPDEGATFRDLRGKQVAPQYIDIVDDPTLATYQGRGLIGHFRYDDEGNPAQRAVLVEKGILKNFLTTAAPIPGQRAINGHARNHYHERPISRMGNLFVINHQPVSDQDMRAMLIEEIRRQKKDYGIHIKEVLGGETGTGNYDFQAFKGEIMNAVRVFPDGNEEPIRGVDFVGTPLSALDAVACLGSNPVLDNGYCGAESGMIPVSTIAPAMLMRNLELQSTEQERFTQYALPLPY